MLEINQLRFTHAGQTRPLSYDFSMQPGEICLITGASGSGKSTLLDLIAGFLTPDSGAIRLEGQDLVDLEPQVRPVSILFQTDNLFDHLGVATNMNLGLPPDTHTSNRTEKIRQALAEVGLEGFGPRGAATLSGGQKQRVALARTLLRGKPILLLDEPFAGLDREITDAVRALILRLTRENNWYSLLVSHDIGDAQALGSRHFTLQQGVLHETALSSA